MKAVLLAFLLVFSASSQSATYYRNRNVYIPGGVCMVDFYGNTINSHLISDVGYGEYRIRVGKFQSDFSWRRMEYIETSTYRTATLLRVVLVNGAIYDREVQPADQAPALKDTFLQLIKDTCK